MQGFASSQCPSVPVSDCDCVLVCVAGCVLRYPSLILPGFLYLGDWADAEQAERLQELKIKRCVAAAVQARAGRQPRCR